LQAGIGDQGLMPRAGCTVNRWSPRNAGRDVARPHRGAMRGAAGAPQLGLWAGAIVLAGRWRALQIEAATRLLRIGRIKTVNEDTSGHAGLPPAGPVEGGRVNGVSVIVSVPAARGHGNNVGLQAGTMRAARATGATRGSSVMSPVSGTRRARQGCCNGGALYRDIGLEPGRRWAGRRRCIQRRGRTRVQGGLNRKHHRGAAGGGDWQRWCSKCNKWRGVRRAEGGAPTQWVFLVVRVVVGRRRRGDGWPLLAGHTGPHAKSRASQLGLRPDGGLLPDCAVWWWEARSDRVQPPRPGIGAG